MNHVARLARLAVTDEAAVRLAGELSRVLDLAQHLAAAPLADIEPMGHPQAHALFWREDVVTQGDQADALLALAPDARAGLYLVPKVIE
ncbi:MAG TPA: Asp-tRNA(Asn)/Glu-tRNA(Gln) amidotransferase subunit GatC [Rudaea sp.]|nr:Asp-tRNA(Asn)/Glu-tRNA(Gln) amidotransferase subunit GatC [Rudaea sp.]